MPFSPKYQITNKMLDYVGTIDSVREVITHAPLVPAWERRFQTEARALIIHHGTHLEGNDLNLDEVEEVLGSDLSPGTVPEKNSRVQLEKGLSADKGTVPSDPNFPTRERDIQEVINYRAVMNYLDTLAPPTPNTPGVYAIPLTRHILSEIHRLTVHNLLPASEAGHFRSVKVVIRNNASGEITFRPPAPTEVPFYIDELFEWLNSEAGRNVHPLLRAGILHYELARIHPFVDGNGRTARAMALLCLFLEGYQVKKFFALEEYYDSHPDEYYTALQSVMSSGELTSWLEYFTLGISIEFNRVKTLVQKLSLDLRLKSTIGGSQITLTDRQIKLVEYLEKHGSLGMFEARDLLPQVSDDTILRDLRDLVEKKLLDRRGNTKGAKYYLKGNL